MTTAPPRISSVDGVKLLPQNLTPVQRRALVVLADRKSASLDGFCTQLWSGQGGQGLQLAACAVLSRLQRLRLVQCSRARRRWRLTPAGQRVAQLS